jgi:hypothetical protein
VDRIEPLSAGHLRVFAALAANSASKKRGRGANRELNHAPVILFRR